MHLFEAIIEANHRAVAGDVRAGLHPAEFADALPVIALTCIDPRLNAFFPNALGLPADQFIWLRNAGNIVTGPLTSTMRSLALACAVKGGREIAIIGHTDCQVGRMTATVLLDRFKELGLDRSHLPANLSEFFGVFGSERANIIKACDFVRNSPLIGPKIPVHGLLLDIGSGQLDWIVNGYQTLLTHHPVAPAAAAFPALGGPGGFQDFALGEMKFPEAKIGEVASKSVHSVPPVPSSSTSSIGSTAAPPLPPPVMPPPISVAPLPPRRLKTPLPPPIRPGSDFRRR